MGKRMGFNVDENIHITIDDNLLNYPDKNGTHDFRDPNGRVTLENTITRNKDKILCILYRAAGGDLTTTSISRK